MRLRPRVGAPFVAAVMTAAVMIAGVVVLAPNALAQSPPHLDLESQTLVVDDDPAEIVLQVLDAPDTARLRVTVYNTPARTRDAVREQHENPPTLGGRIADFECTLDGDCRGQAMMSRTADTVTITLDDAEIGESLRARPGALPFVVGLVDEDGQRLDTLATSLVVPRRTAPDEAEAEPRVKIAFLHEVGAPLALQPDLDLDIDGTAVLDAAAVLADHPDLPVTTELRPETLDALAATDPAALAGLLEILGERPLVRGSWVEMDEEAWRVVGESDQVVSQYARGNDTIESITGAPPSGLVRLDTDARPETLTLLRTAGVTTVVVDDSQLSDATLDTDPDQPFPILDANGVAITALRVDDALHATLAADDPELAAHHATTELIALHDEATTELGVLLDLGRIEPATLALMLDLLDPLDGLTLVDVAELAEGDLARSGGETLRGELEPTVAPDVSDLATDVRDSFLGLATIARMIDPEIDALTPFVDLLQAAVSSDLTPASADDYVARVDQEVDTRRSGIEILDGARVTLTDRRTDLPLTIVNGQPVPVNVELLLAAEKLRFPDGDRVSITLEPGETHLTVPVETLASGDARVSATLVSPGGYFELGSGSVDVRSTALSGLGLIISVIALLVLGVWWVRTIIRIRRNRGAATVSAESPDDVLDPDDPARDTTPTEGES